MTNTDKDSNATLSHRLLLGSLNAGILAVIAGLFTLAAAHEWRRSSGW